MRKVVSETENERILRPCIRESYTRAFWRCVIRRRAEDTGVKLLNVLGNRKKRKRLRLRVGLMYFLFVVSFFFFRRTGDICVTTRFRRLTVLIGCRYGTVGLCPVALVVLSDFYFSN